MVKLLIIADDFTGALDTSVQFAAKGAATTVVTDPDYDFQSASEAVEVLVMVAETRHLLPQDAYQVLRRTVHDALQAGVIYIYKKTDSALRGNAGSELAAVMDAAGVDTLPFFPAFPKLNRITKEGIHYIDGDVPVARSVFGQDPFEPVLDSAVADILGQQTDKAMVVHTRRESSKIVRPGIQIFDAETDEDLKRLGRELGLDGLRFCAGCAGFAAVLAELLEVGGRVPKPPELERALFMCCGSVNPVTLNQMRIAQEYGFHRISLNPVQKLAQSWADSAEAAECVRRWLALARTERKLILDVNDPEGCRDTEHYACEHALTLDQLRVRISANLAGLMKRVLDGGLYATLLCTGGDTLLSLMRALDVSELMPICEMATGVVLTEFTYRGKAYHIISKSGGFGEPDLLVELAKRICPQSATD